MELSLKNRIYIESIANTARKKVDSLSDKTVLEYKDATKYVTYFGGEVIYDKYRENSAIFKIQENKFRIYVKEETVEEVLHELGHAFLHWDKIPDHDTAGAVGLENTGSVIDVEELSANYFVRVFLMPAQKFIDNVLAKTYNNICDFEELSHYFNVSKSLIVSRGKDLELW